MVDEIGKFVSALREASEKDPEVEKRIRKINNLLEIQKGRELNEEEQADKFSLFAELEDLLFGWGAGETFDVMELERTVKPNGNICSIMQVR